MTLIKPYDRDRDTDNIPDAPDPLDQGDRAGGPLEDAGGAAVERWAEWYDGLNGAPESDEDR